MKYAVIAALVATVASKEVPCNPGKLQFKLFHDAKCTKFDKELTGKYGTPAKEDFHYFEPGCQHDPKQKWGWTFMCSAKGMHQTVWDNQKCHGKEIADLKYEWNSCQKSPDAEGIWFMPTSTQF